jgi:TatD DNase family protein
LYKPKGKARLEEYKKKQKEIFVKQIDLALEFNLPLIVHCRVAFDDAYEILKNKKLKGVIHLLLF